jgi:hypothetical protein
MNAFGGFVAGLLGRDLIGAVGRGVAGGARAAMSGVARGVVRSAKGTGAFTTRVLRASRKVPGLSRLARRIRRWGPVREATRAASRRRRYQRAADFQPAQADVERNIDYGRMIGNMANPQAAEIEQNRAAGEAKEEEKSNRAKAARDKEEQAVEAVTKGMLQFGASLVGIPPVVVGFGFALKRFSDTVLESRRTLSMWGPIGGAFAEFDVKNLLLEMKTASEVQGSTIDLLKQEARARAAWQPVRSKVANIENEFAIRIAGISEALGGVANEALKRLEAISEWIVKHDPMGGGIIPNILIDAKKRAERDKARQEKEGFAMLREMRKLADPKRTIHQRRPLPRIKH